MKVLKEAVKRTEEDRKNLTETVSRMIEEVRCKKDEALKAYNLQFDGCTRETLQVSREEIQKAYSQLTGQEKESGRKYPGICQSTERNGKAFGKFQPHAGNFLRTQDSSGGILLLLCARWELSPVFYSVNADYSCKNRRGKAGGSLFSGDERNQCYQSQDFGCHGHCRRG